MSCLIVFMQRGVAMKGIFGVHGSEGLPEILPVIPTMDVVVFPQMIVPLLVVDEKIIKGINETLEQSKLVLLLAAKNHHDGHGAIGTNDLYSVGTIGSIMRMVKVPEGGVKILVQGLHKAHIQEIITEHDSLKARFVKFDTQEVDPQELAPQIRGIKSLAEKMANAGNVFSPDFFLIISKMNDPEKIADFVLSHLNLSVAHAQVLLETVNQKDFLASIYEHLVKEMEVSEIQEKIRNNARESMNQSHKEFYLREQLRAIKKELGEQEDEDIFLLHEKLDKLQVNNEIRSEVRRQINRLERTAPDSLEATVTRNYLEWIFALPWGVYSSDTLDIELAKRVLDQDHFGLKEIKDRILDFICVRNLKQDGYAPILCFVGPPGTGKTSLGKSIALSLGRSYARISLGGVKDEAEIRGHRRTYVGAMPGRFIQAMRKAGSSNPVIVIDELDKIGADFRGDPSAAMLEVLDPQQNQMFHDNYLGVPFDLSKVMFVATANNIDALSEPLRDRMEVIELSGYAIEEKMNIARHHLERKAFFDMGLESRGITLAEDVLNELVTGYTKESGVRQLERIIRRLCSKAAREIVEHNKQVSFTMDNLEHYLGPRKYLNDFEAKEGLVGIANGLAWTAYGGEIITIEAVLMQGKGKLQLTGQLGEVMKESAQAAISYARAHAAEFGIDQKMFTRFDLHIHAPAGAIPKDGPSAGITLLAAIISAYTKVPISPDFAMTGEINLCGEVMPIGGLKEKVLAAKRNRIPYVIAPFKNKNDLIGTEALTNDVDIIWVRHANEVIERVLSGVLINRQVEQTQQPEEFMATVANSNAL
jgi:ATP-dependent Lon protease